MIKTILSEAVGRALVMPHDISIQQLARTLREVEVYQEEGEIQ